MLAGLIRPKKKDALIEAAEHGELSRVEKLIERDGVNVNCQDDKRSATPLMRAAAHGQLPVVKYLLQHGARTDVVDNVGWTALCWACYGAGSVGWVMEDTLKVLRAILDRPETKLLHRTHTGHTALMLYVKYLNNKGAVLSGAAQKLEDEYRKTLHRRRGKANMPKPPKPDIRYPTKRNAWDEQEDGLRMIIVQANPDGTNRKAVRKLFEARNMYDQDVYALCSRRRVRVALRELFSAHGQSLKHLDPTLGDDDDDEGESEESLDEDAIDELPPEKQAAARRELRQRRARKKKREAEEEEDEDDVDWSLADPYAEKRKERAALLAKQKQEERERRQSRGFFSRLFSSGNDEEPEKKSVKDRFKKRKPQPSRSCFGGV